MMPNLDVTDILYDPDFCEPMTVFRRAVVVGNNGRQTITQSQILPKPTGILVPSFTEVMGNQTSREPDMKYTPRALRVFSPFLLQAPCPGYDADLIIYMGDTYVVNKVISFTHFGQGFIIAECASIDSIDLPPNYT